MQSKNENYPEDLIEALKGTHEFVSAIGSGAMGAVYQVRNKLLDRNEAVKIIKGNITPERLRRLQQEAKALGRTSGYGIASIYNIAATPSGRPYILMEYLEGASLKNVIKDDGPLGADWILFVLHQICAGLETAHKLGIIHRDVKPDNIIISETESGIDIAKLIDFGIAKSRIDPQELTQGNTSLGTPLYMSPEQFVQGQEIDTRADIYSLACVAFEMFSGNPPFQAATALELIDMHLHREPPLLPGQFRRYETIINKAMAKNPDDRYPSAMGFWRDLYAALWNPLDRPSILIAETSHEILKSRKDPPGLQKEVKIFWCMVIAGSFSILVAMIAGFGTVCSMLDAISKARIEAKLFFLIALLIFTRLVFQIIRVRRKYPENDWRKETPR